MRKIFLAVMMAVIVAAMGGVAMAQDPPTTPTLQLRTVTLIPFAKDKPVQGGFMLDIHVWPEPKPVAATDKNLIVIGKKIQSTLARHTSLSWFQTGETLSDIASISEGSLGVSINFMAREATINAGAVWRQQDNNWYGHLDFRWK